MFFVFVSENRNSEIEPHLNNGELPNGRKTIELKEESRDQGSSVHRRSSLRFVVAFPLSFVICNLDLSFTKFKFIIYIITKTNE